MPRYRLTARADEQPEAAGASIAVAFEHIVAWGLTMSDLEHTSGVVYVSVAGGDLSAEQLEHVGLEEVAA